MIILDNPQKRAYNVFISEKGNEEEEYIEGLNRESGSPAARPLGTVSMESSF